MLIKKITTRVPAKSIRSQNGFQLAEFSAAFVLLVFCIIIPICDLGIVPFRWFLAKQMILSETKHLALSKNLSSAMESANLDSTFSDRLQAFTGAKLIAHECNLVITMVNKPYESCHIADPKTIKSEWLPDGKKGPCCYELEVRTTVELSPLVVLSGLDASIPGLTRPFKFNLDAHSSWNNLGRDPSTNRFYLNE